MASSQARRGQNCQWATRLIGIDSALVSSMAVTPLDVR